MTGTGLGPPRRARLAELASELQRAHRAVALTGAGVSTDSGIPDFRSPASGLWREVDPMRVASVDGFREDPRGFYEFWRVRFASMDEAEPNITHRVLAALQAREQLDGIVTQNIDGLHGRAGSERVLEVHGNWHRSRCLHCGLLGEIDEVFERVAAGRLPICERCGDFVKPDVTLFGEALPPSFAEAERWVSAADLLIVLGSSLEVHPVAGLVPLARASGARLVIVNRDETPYEELANLVLHEPLADVMAALIEDLGLTGC